ncbi:MYND-type domain-containing protein [Mycena sanguinolenta]|uniref:MYND-type domain-containing protein n=1 Tax=Mycena sanguinolenta TaxID=230812 RepID=A0A8H7D6D8_9AGAR|nr:MYND-type domain-containing protein [Mycena sanguinolenta]
MHRSLALERLHELPFSLRRRALAAASGDAEELGLLNMSPANVARLLPLYYAGLEAADIPPLLAQLDLSSTGSGFQAFTRKLSHVVMCLQGILLFDTHRPSGLSAPLSADLWARVWPWMLFLDTYRDNLPRLNITDVNPLSLIMVLGQHGEVSRSMRMTPGFFVVVFRAWKMILGQKTQLPGEFEILCACMHNLRLPGPITDDQFEEAIEGSGGSTLSFARLCVDHVKCVVKSVVPGGVDSIWCVIACLHKRCEKDDSFRVTLVNQGILPALASAACRFSSPPFTTQNNLLHMPRIIQYFITVSGHSMLTEALHRGLLRAVLTWGRMRDPQILEPLNLILNAFSRSSVYLSVLLQFQKSIKDLEPSIDSHTFRGFPVSDDWETLWSILQTRWALMDIYLEREKLSACGNIECCLIASKSVFKRCSHCLAKYCSKECQIYDWQHGAHRQHCSLKFVDPQIVAGTRSRQFLKALLHDDYLRLKHTILNNQLAYLRANPGTSLYVQFDYRTGVCEVSVKALDNEMWKRENARTSKSEGRMQIHMMRVSDGLYGEVTYIFPLYSSTGECRIGIEALAAKDACEETDRAQIQHLLELDILETHL